MNAFLNKLVATNYFRKKGARRKEAFAVQRHGDFMSIVIVGGNECMIRQYKDLCNAYNCKAKVYPKMTGSLKNIGSPDLLVLFTNTVSHKMIRCALSEAKGQKIKIARSHTSSMAALKNILTEHTAGREA